MSGGPRFPKRPLAERDAAFRDRDGKNPFADHDGTPAANDDAARSENIFAPTQEVRAAIAAPQAFVATEVAQVGTARRLATTGLILHALATIVGLQRLWLSFTLLLLPFSFVLFTLGLVMSGTALAVAGRDLRAVRAGAMDGGELAPLLRQRRRAITGTLWGVLGWSVSVFWFLWSVFG